MKTKRRSRWSRILAIVLAMTMVLCDQSVLYASDSMVDPVAGEAVTEPIAGEPAPQAEEAPAAEVTDPQPAAETPATEVPDEQDPSIADDPTALPMDGNDQRPVAEDPATPENPTTPAAPENPAAPTTPEARLLRKWIPPMSPGLSPFWSVLSAASCPEK